MPETAPRLLGKVIDKSVDEELEWHERHWWLWGCLILEIALIAGMYAYHVWWERKRQREAAHFFRDKEAEELGLHIIRHFLPSAKVEKYRFRGMKTKVATMDIRFEELGLQIHGSQFGEEGKVVLDGVTGEFLAGRMVAIMGPSGAGKTTFMNVLCGKATYGKMRGKIYINGEEGDIKNYKSVMGFVPQDDIVHESLTVSEQIKFSAELRNPSSTSLTRCGLIAEDVLNVMQIDHIQNSIVGGQETRGISGGQRKRVNIGLEMAACPTVLFLDEPTSGLDSTSSLSVVHSLKKMAQLGLTSVMVIHQPRYSLFTLFDDVLLLGKGGRTVYLGPSTNAKEYFESIGFEMPKDENPADWFMDVICGEVPNKSIPNFKPEMLFELWERNKNQLARARTTGARAWTPEDDKQVLAKRLQDEWSKIDLNHDGVLDEDELRALLGNCIGVSGTELDDEAIHQLFQRMVDDDADVVDQQEFLDYFTGLLDLIAHDKELQRQLYGEESDGEDNDEEQGSGEDDEEQAGLRARDWKKRHGGLVRTIPGYPKQFKVLGHRRLIQWFRMKGRLLFLGVICFAALVLAIMDEFITVDAIWSADVYLNMQITLALLTSVFCLETFGADKPMFWREASSGLNIFAFFNGRVLVNTVDLLLQCFSFCAIYYIIRQPQLEFFIWFFPFLLVSYASAGWGYFISAIVPRQHGPFIAALVSFVICGLMGHPQKLVKYLDGGVLEVGMSCLSITRWSVQMSFLEYQEVAPTTPKSQQEAFVIEGLKDTYNKGMWNDALGGYWWSGIWMQLAMGIVLRFCTYLGLRFMYRDKMI